MKKLLAMIVLGLALLSAGGVQGQGSNSYSTNFPATENPISEGGRWINGQAVGLDWKDVRTIPGLAYGADSSGNPNFNDPTALLNGTWGPDQTLQGTVHSVNQRSGSSNVFQEVEFRLRSTITAHRNSGYEVNFRCNHDGSQYIQIVRWNGPLGSFNYINEGSGPGIRDGDVVKATIIGNKITAYVNNVQVVSATDSTFASGNPGIGFYLLNGGGSNADYGFRSFSASDGGSLTAPAPPTNVRIVRLSQLLIDVDPNIPVLVRPRSHARS